MASTVGTWTVRDGPVPPIVVGDIQGVDLSVHDSIEDAALALEPIDVRRNRYVAFDGLGRRLNLEVSHSEGRAVERILFTVADDGPRHKEDLRERLVAYLVASGEQVTTPSTLEDLLARTRERTKGH